MNLVNDDRTTKILSVVLAVVFGVLFVTLVANAVTTISTNIVTGGTLAVTGASTLTGNVTAEGTLTVDGASTLTGNVTMSGGNGALTITTSNSATSTVEVGCVQMYATSTDTAVRLLFHSTTTPVVISGTASGFVAWGYGTCPF